MAVSVDTSIGKIDFCNHLTTKRVISTCGYHIVPNPLNLTCNAGLSWSISVSVSSDWITSISSSSNCNRILATLSWWLKSRGLIFVVWSENKLEIQNFSWVIISYLTVPNGTCNSCNENRVVIPCSRNQI